MIVLVETQLIDTMKAHLSTYILVLVFLALACATRFYRLDWSVCGDHTSTFREVRTLMEKPFFLPRLEPSDVQPRTVPVGYALHALSYRVFGTAEAGSRMGSAIAGAAAIALCVFLTAKLYGASYAAILGAMLVLWPWLLYHSQNNRHYGYAFLFASLAMLATATAWRRNSFRWGAAGGVFSALAISSHCISAIVPAGFALFLLFEHWVKKTPTAKRAVIGYLVVGGPLMVLSVALAVWAFGGYVDAAAEAGWGRSPHLLGLAYNIGWSVLLLSVVGWCLSWSSTDPTERMWAMIATLAVVACIAVPFITAFRPDYVFPSALAYLMLGTGVLDRAYHALLPKSRATAVGVVLAVVLVPLPSFCSHYQDGDRYDYRTAAAFIKEHLQPGDQVAADTAGALGYYLDVPVFPVGRPSTTAPRTVAALADLASGGQRVWYVCRSSREEPAPEVDRWFWNHALRMLRIKYKRFDYHENILDIYLFNAKSSDREQIDEEVPREPHGLE